MKIKYLISLLFAVTAVVLTMAINVSAAVSTDWNTNTSTAVNSDMTLYITDGSEGTVEVGAGVTLTVDSAPTVTSLNNDLGVVLNTGARLIWNADFNVSSSEKLIVSEASSATDTRASFSGANIRTTASVAVRIDSGIDMVTIENDSSITSTTGTGIETASNLTMTSGEVTGRNGISATGATVNLSGGTVTSTGQTASATAVWITGATATTINGATIVAKEQGVYIDNSAATLEMISGSVSAATGIEIYHGDTLEISGGTITGTPTLSGYGVTSRATTTRISGGDISGGYEGFSLWDGTAYITGGSFSAISRSSGYGIYRNNLTDLYITPGLLSPVIIQGKTSAIGLADGTFGSPYLSGNLYYFVGENPDGTAKQAYKESSDPYVYDVKHKYIEFLAAVPIVAAPPAPEPESAPGPDYSTPSTAMEHYIIPEIKNPRGDSIPEWIEVTATLNESDTVNGRKTAEDVAAAHRMAERLGGGKILLHLPTDTIGISETAMKRIVKAASDTEIYLIFDFWYTEYDEKWETDVQNIIGHVYFRLSDETGQILTEMYIDSDNIDTAQSYIEKHFDTEVLGSFETSQKGDWGETANISVIFRFLGFTAVEGEDYYVLIHDTKTKKWYQTKVDDDLYINTSHSGVVTIVTDSVK
jgi:hypothetical protein